MKHKFSISLIFSILVIIAVNKLLTGGIMWPLLSGIAGFILMHRFIAQIQKRVKTGKGLSPAHIKAAETAERGMEQIRRIRTQTMKIKDNTVAGKIKEICAIGTEILSDIRENPRDLRRAKPFTTYYLDAFEKIVTMYVDLSRKKELNPAITASLARAENLLDQIRGTYKKQLANLLEDDILDLNTEISLLEKTMKLEG